MIRKSNANPLFILFYYYFRCANDVKILVGNVVSLPEKWKSFYTIDDVRLIEIQLPRVVHLGMTMSRSRKPSYFSGISWRLPRQCPVISISRTPQRGGLECHSYTRRAGALLSSSLSSCNKPLRYRKSSHGTPPATIERAPKGPLSNNSCGL